MEMCFNYVYEGLNKRKCIIFSGEKMSLGSFIIVIYYSEEIMLVFVCRCVIWILRIYMNKVKNLFGMD